MQAAPVESELQMRAPAVTPGIGSLLLEEGCRFRVWAPNTTLVQVIGYRYKGSVLHKQEHLSKLHRVH